MPQGDRRGNNLDLLDFAYDGENNDQYLSGGLGQLTDQELGHSNFRLSPPGLGIKGYEWIGWKNDSLNQDPVEILFEFDKVRRFTLVTIHANNYFTKDVHVFRSAQLLFSVGGRYYSTTPVDFRYVSDNLIEYARTVIIRIPNRVARYIKLRLFYNGRWILISEVSFKSGERNGLHCNNNNDSTCVIYNIYRCTI